MATITFQEDCAKCSGEGTVPTGGAVPGEPATCPDCGGSGKMPIHDSEELKTALDGIDTKLDTLDSHLDVIETKIAALEP